MIVVEPFVVLGLFPRFSIELVVLVPTLKLGEPLLTCTAGDEVAPVVGDEVAITSAPPCIEKFHGAVVFEPSEREISFAVLEARVKRLLYHGVEVPIAATDAVDTMPALL